MAVGMGMVIRISVSRYERWYSLLCRYPMILGGDEDGDGNGGWIGVEMEMEMEMEMGMELGMGTGMGMEMGRVAIPRRMWCSEKL